MDGTEIVLGKTLKWQILSFCIFKALIECLFIGPRRKKTSKILLKLRKAHYLVGRACCEVT